MPSLKSIAVVCRAQQRAPCDDQRHVPIYPLNVKCSWQSSKNSTLSCVGRFLNRFVFRFRILSEDDLHLLEIPEPPTIVSKTDNRSSIGSGSAITTEPKMSITTTAAAGKKTPMVTNKMQQHPTYQQSHSSIIFENDQMSNVNEPSEMASILNGNSSMNNLKNCIQKLQSVIAFHAFSLRLPEMNS